MTKFPRPFSKITLFFLACSALINKGFADDLKWKGLQASGIVGEKKDFQVITDVVTDVRVTDADKKKLLGETSFYLDDKSCYEPQLQRDFDSQDRIIFSDETLFNRIECSKMEDSQLNVGSFVFRDDKEFTIHISNRNTLSLHQGNGIINEGAKPVEFDLDEKATLNFLGESADKNLEARPSLPVHYQMKDESQLNFKGDSSAAEAKVNLFDNSTLTFSTSNKTNSLCALNTSPSSTVELNESFLTLGNSGSSDTLNGTLSGGKSSSLIKQGDGVMSLNGDCSEFKGEILVNKGSVVLKKNLGGNVEVKGSEAAFVFHDNEASVGSNEINVNQGKVLFQNKSSAGKAKISIVDGELNFQGHSTGEQAKVTLSDNSTLTFSTSNHANSLDALNTAPSSKVELNESFLTLGNSGSNDALNGTLSGGKSSSLIKQGDGVMSLNGDCSEFKGEILVNKGSVVLKKNLSGNVEVKGSEAAFVFHDNEASVGSNEINVSQGKVLFQNKSSAGEAKISIVDGELNFQGHSTGEQAKVTLYDNSTLTFSTDNDVNSLDALNTAPSSKVELSESFLTLGNSGSNDTLNGTLSGGKSSFLIKKGDGIMSLNGDCSAFKGKIVVNDGSVALKKNLGGNIEVAGSPETAFEFHDYAGAGSNQITVNQGKVIFKEESSANTAQITVVNGEIGFQDNSKGNQASVCLWDNAKISIGQNNSLGSLYTGENSLIDLDQFALTIGSLNQDNGLAGKIIGNESSQFIKEGTGTLSLYGKNKSFKGDMVVNGGKVILSDSHLGGNLIINPASQLSGSGSVAKNLINNDGVIDLNENDTLKISGNFSQSENSECLLKVNKKGQNSKIEVEGKGTLDNSPLQVSGDYRLCHPYEILEAKEIEGGFQEKPKYMQTLPSTVELIVNNEHEENKEKIVLRFVPNLVREEYTANQQNTAEQFRKINNLTDDHENSLRDLLNEKDIPHALDQLSGVQYTNFILASERSTQQFIRRIYTPMRAISIDHDCEELCENKWIAWADAEAGKTFQKGKHGYDMLEYNFTAAIQRSMNDWLTESCPLSEIIPCTWLTGWTAGLAGSYSQQRCDFDHGGEAHLHNIQGAFYTLLTKPLYYLVLDFIFGSTTGKMERTIKCGCINEKAHGDVRLFQGTFYGELGLNNIICCNLIIQPFMGIEAGYFNLDGCKEHGAGLFDLKIKEHSDCLTTSYMGLHFLNFQNDDCGWGFSADIVWKHLFEYDNHLEKKFACFGDKFKICGHESGQNGIEGTLTYFQRISHSWLINAEISGEIWENYSNFYLSAGLSYKW